MKTTEGGWNELCKYVLGFGHPPCERTITDRANRESCGAH